MNQIVKRTTPGYVQDFGTAHTNATVTVNFQPTYQHGDYFRKELAFDNAAGAVWATLTNIGVLQQGTNADIVTTNILNAWLPAASATFLYDPDGNLTNDGRFAYTWDSENRLTKVESLSNLPEGKRRRATFEYDFLGRRIRMGLSVSNTAWSVIASNKFLYDGWNLVAELNATNNAVICT